MYIGLTLDFDEVIYGYSPKLIIVIERLLRIKWNHRWLFPTFEKTPYSKKIDTQIRLTHTSSRGFHLSLIFFLNVPRYIHSCWWRPLHKASCLLCSEVNKYQILPLGLSLPYLAFLFLIQKLFFDLGGIHCCLCLTFIWSLEIWYCLLGLSCLNLWGRNWYVFFF